MSRDAVGNQAENPRKSSTGPNVQILNVSPMSRSPEDFCINTEQEKWSGGQWLQHKGKGGFHYASGSPCPMLVE